MFLTRLIASLAEFTLSIVLSVFIVYWSYKSFVRFTTDYDAEEEIRRGNVAVALLMSSLMFGAALILQQSIYPVVSIVTVSMTGGESAGGLLRLAACALGHLVLGFLLAVGCMEFALRFFARLSREIDEHAEVRKGNVAVAVLMSSVILVIALFLQQGVGTLNKSLIPQPKLGELSLPPL